MPPREQVLQALYSKTGHEPKQSGAGWTSRGPTHDNRNPSLAVNEAEDGRVLLTCHAGCSFEAICAALDLAPRDLFPRSTSTQPKKTREKRGLCRRRHDQRGAGAKETCPTCKAAVTELRRRHGKRSALWAYEDADRQPVGVIVRWDGPDGKDIQPVSRNGDGWIIRGLVEPRPLYFLPHGANSTGKAAGPASRQGSGGPARQRF